MLDMPIYRHRIDERDLRAEIRRKNRVIEELHAEIERLRVALGRVEKLLDQDPSDIAVIIPPTSVRSLYLSERK